MARIARLAAQSATIHVLADIAAQQLERFGTARSGGIVSENGRWDAARTARFGVVGATLHGPYFGLGFGAVDRWLGSSRALGVVARKVIVTQVLLNPPYLVLLFGWLSVLEGRSIGWEAEGIGGNTLSKAQATLAPNFAFWPFANAANFLFVPPQFRVAYVAACGGVWNTFISIVNNKTYEI